MVATATWQPRLRGVPCGLCGTTEQEDTMIVCDRCERCYHPGYITAARGFVEPNDGPWYCKTCRTHIITNGHQDLIEDLALLDLLFANKEP